MSSRLNQVHFKDQEESLIGESFKKERKHFVSSRMKKPKEERKKEAEESKKPVEGKSISGALANPFQSISLPFFSFHPTFIFVSLSWQ